MDGAVPRVLVATGVPETAQFFGKCFRNEFLKFEFVNCCHKVMHLLDDRPCDLVVCDTVMPNGTGFELCRQMKAHPTWRFIPVMLLSAGGGNEEMIRGVASGADDFLTQPLEGVFLRARIGAMLRVRKLFAELQTAADDTEGALRRHRERLINHAQLSPREREVLDLLLMGRTHSEVGLALGISARTAKFHQQKILEKLDADSRRDLMRLFF